MSSNSDIAVKGIERILELAADADKRRQGVVVDPPEFHNLTGAIAAYDRALVILVALQQREEFHTIISESDEPDCVYGAN